MDLLLDCLGFSSHTTEPTCCVRLLIKLFLSGPRFGFSFKLVTLAHKQLFPCESVNSLERGSLSHVLTTQHCIFLSKVLIAAFQVLQTTFISLHSSSNPKMSFRCVISSPGRRCSVFLISADPLLCISYSESCTK